MKHLKLDQFLFRSNLVAQDCINGLITLSGRCRDICLIDLYCKTDTAVRNNSSEHRRLKRMSLVNCKLEHCDVTADKRVVIDELELGPNTNYLSKLFILEHLKVLCLR